MHLRLCLLLGSRLLLRLGLRLPLRLGLCLCLGLRQQNETYSTSFITPCVFSHADPACHEGMLLWVLRDSRLPQQHCSARRGAMRTTPLDIGRGQHS